MKTVTISLDGDRLVYAEKKADARRISLEEFIQRVVNQGIYGRSRRAEVCLVPHCGEGSKARGLCSRHYQTANYYVLRGNLSLGWLVKQKKLGAPRGDRFIEPVREPVLPRGADALPDDKRWLFGLAPHSERAPSFLERVASAPAGEPTALADEDVVVGD